MMKNEWIIALLMVGLMGCYATDSSIQSSGESNPVHTQTGSIHVKGPDPAVQVNLTLSDNRVSSAHPIKVTIDITNMTDERILWGHGSSNCHHILLVVFNEEQYVAVISDRVCMMDESPHYLDPRETDSQTVVWAGEVRERGSLSPGSYDLIGAAGFHRSVPITIVVE
jgi:hypothetical protein